jgi:hypothetical protein
MAMKPTYVKLDSRNRLSLTKITKNLSSLYRVYVQDDKIILEPIREIPDEERWLFDPANKEIVERLKRSLQQEGVNDWDTIKKHLKL